MASSLLMMKVVMTALPILVMGTQTVTNPKIPKEGDEFLLECEGDGVMDSFMLHQMGDALAIGVHDTLEIEVFQNASVLFQRITLKHEGTHLCLRKKNERLHGYTTPLRVRPLPPDDLWNDVYETKFVTGILAALVLAAMFAVGCLVYQYRWQPKPEKDQQPILGASSGYDNPALSRADEKGGDVESNSSTHF